MSDVLAFAVAGICGAALGAALYLALLMLVDLVRTYIEDRGP